MYFDATPTNMIAVLISSLAIVSLALLMRQRYDTSMPLLFYFFAVVFANSTDRAVHPVVIYGGLAFALLLRFEFMGPGFTKFVAFCTQVGLACMTWVMLSRTVATQ